jgi:hypothetical protein
MADVIKEDDDIKDDDIIIVEEDPNKKPVANDNDDEADDGDDDRIKGADDDDDIHPDDPDNKERDAIRERRRLEKLERKQRRDDAIKRDKLEMDFLRKRNDDLERRLTAQEQRAHTADLRGFDSEIARAQQEAEMAEKVIAKAVAAGNGDDVAQALKYRDQALQRAQQLAWQKQQASQQPPAQSGADDVAMGYAKQFLADNKWYDPQGRDEDSAIVLAIDQAMNRDGYDPRNPDYWDELRKRAARRLPERFAAPRSERTRDNTQTREERTARGGPAVGSGKEHAPTSTRQEVYVSPERKQALIEAGVWDDPVLRQRYVKRYSDYDKQNRA